MKKLSVPMIVAPFLAILVVGTALAAASASKPMPFKGSIEAQETYQANGPAVFVTASGSGEATQLGRYTVSYEVEVDLPTGTGTGLSAHFVAANGDSLFAEGSGQATPTDDPIVFFDRRDLYDHRRHRPVCECQWKSHCRSYCKPRHRGDIWHDGWNYYAPIGQERW